MEKFIGNGDSKHGYEILIRVKNPSRDAAIFLAETIESLDDVHKLKIIAACDGTRESWGEIDMFGDPT